MRETAWNLRGFARGVLVGGAILATAAVPALGVRGGGMGADDFPRDRPGPGPCSATIQKLKSTNPATADAAYRRLFATGKMCVGELLDLAGDKTEYAGRAFESEASCSIAMAAVSVDRVALYLVDAILVGNPTPHYSTALLSASQASSEVLLDRATAAYQAWWNDHNAMPLRDLQRMPHPLAGTGISWHGLVRPRGGAGNIVFPGPRQNGKPVPGSETPVAPGDLDDICIAQQAPYSWTIKPEDPTGPDPYNCMAWAIKCYTDRWIQPDPNGGWEDILEDHGYDPGGSTIDCKNQSCANGGTKLKMVWEVGPGEKPGDDNWVHAMKQEAGANWSSKNGQGPRYENITDCEAFLNTHYPTAPGKTRVVRCYCPTTVVSD